MDPAKLLSEHLPIAPSPPFTLNQVHNQHATMADNTIPCRRILGRTMSVITLPASAACESWPILPRDVEDEADDTLSVPKDITHSSQISRPTCERLAQRLGSVSLCILEAPCRRILAVGSLGLRRCGTAFPRVGLPYQCCPIKRVGEVPP